MKHYFKKLKELRKSKDLKQSEISKILNVSQQTYSRYETGQILIDVNSLIKLSKFYNVSIDYILGLTEDPKPYISA